MQNPDFRGKNEGFGLAIWTTLAVHPFLRALTLITFILLHIEIYD